MYAWSFSVLQIEYVGSPNWPPLELIHKLQCSAWLLDWILNIEYCLLFIVDKIVLIIDVSCHCLYLFIIFQMKYSLLDEQDISLVERYAFEVSQNESILLVTHSLVSAL